MAPPSGTLLAVLLLVYLTALHLSGLALFTRGFLLSRLALPHTTPSTAATTLPATHARAVVLIIDALRWDFLAPAPPRPHSPYHHNVLTLPAHLAAAHPDRAFLFHTYADPPTSTLQRLKAITTGSLPTFIDVSSNFFATAHASSISEDSLLSQLKRHPHRFPHRAFMGDDTWLSIYPDAFSDNLTSPYDSFNVEDLHSVDLGVTRTLLPLLHAQLPQGAPAHAQPFQFLIAHFLGVDHVGHRLGPDHPAMRAKLHQMDTLLRDVVPLLQDDTLLVLLGDHGMDPKGDHGGDSVLEVSTTTFVYSPGPALSQLPTPPPPSLTPHTLYPGSDTPARAVQQIDLLPSLSLLLGLPIPFNNLGAVIPELFWRPGPGGLEAAVRANVHQVWGFLQAYRASPSGGELDDAWDRLERAYVTAKSVGKPPRPDSAGAGAGAGDQARIAMGTAFVRGALETCRALWAQFDVALISLGLAVLLLAVLVLARLYADLARYRAQWEAVVRAALRWAALGAAAGAALGWAAKRTLQAPDAVGKAGLPEWILFGASSSSALFLLLGSFLPPSLSPREPLRWSFDALLACAVIGLHTASFTSNSFLLWEDHVVPYLLLTLLLPTLLRAPAAPTTHLQYRLLGYPLLLAACVRTMALSTVCREEQHASCSVTFYSSATRPVSPAPVLALALPAAWALPSLIQRFLATSKSDRGPAPLFLQYALRASLLASTTYWLLEQLESWPGLNQDRIPALKNIRMSLARILLSTTLIGGYALWALAPPCVELHMREPEPDPQLIVLGYTNAYGALYLLFLLVFYALLFAATQLTGQLVLALFALALLAHLETTDSVRDPVLLALLGHHLFFATGHQAVLSSIQWKTAFIGFKVVTYPFSPVLVGLNSVGPLFLSALALPLLAMWQVSPVLSTQQGRVYVLSDTLKAAVGFMLYHSLVTLSAAACAAWFRRHLMVWKVFAPRFMLSGITLLVIDLGLILAVGVGSAVTCSKVRKMFGTAP
ncbi:alkaline phosphatase-like protein [Calocera cornea HHB12733]|uniref:Alkaline phosphatase-like protein n=1 Tax=Calocera cornea HHB12733 TaxID=1353952 RepID=A0A165DIA6_9BASI|nr:alkaline phosphatase-like protein [Calocera cornea HHB12733]